MCWGEGAGQFLLLPENGSQPSRWMDERKTCVCMCVEKSYEDFFFAFFLCLMLKPINEF